MSLCYRLVFVICLLGLIPNSLAAQASESADLIFLNGHVRTPQGWATAVAVRKGVIIAVSDAAGVRGLANPCTQVIDLEGDALLPGLHDSHVHPIFAGLEQFQCRLPVGADAAGIRSTVHECASRKAPGGWIVGGNWLAGAFRPGEQTRGLLDLASPDNPVLLNDAAHHSIWLSSAALKAVGISRTTPKPEGGSSSMIVMACPTACCAKLADLSSQGLIRQRMRGCLVWDSGPAELRADEESLIDDRAVYARPRFATDCVKIFMDGVSTESHTGAMLDPHVDADARPHDEWPPKGLLLVSQGIGNSSSFRQTVLVRPHGWLTSVCAL
jgi:hypothetical protein